MWNLIERTIRPGPRGRGGGPLRIDRELQSAPDAQAEPRIVLGEAAANKWVQEPHERPQVHVELGAELPRHRPLRLVGAQLPRPRHPLPADAELQREAQLEQLLLAALPGD